VLPRTEVNRLLASRSRYGVKRPQGAESGSPLAAEDVNQHGNERLMLTRDELLGLIEDALRART